jgi:hypothetical protein
VAWLPFAVAWLPFAVAWLPFRWPGCERGRVVDRRLIGAQPLIAAAMMAVACSWMAARWSGPRKDSAYSL